MQHTGFGSVPQLVVWGREVRGAGWFRAVWTAGTEGRSTSAASTLKPGRPLNKANGTFCGDPPGLPLGLPQGAPGSGRERLAAPSVLTEPHSAQLGRPAGGPVWTGAQHELPAGTGLPAPDRVHERFHAVPGRNGVRRTFQVPAWPPGGGSCAWAAGTESLMGWEGGLPGGGGEVAEVPAGVWAQARPAGRLGAFPEGR